MSGIVISTFKVGTGSSGGCEGQGGGDPSGFGGGRVGRGGHRGRFYLFWCSDVMIYPAKH